MPSIIFAPLLPLPWLAAAAVLAVALLGLSAYRRRAPLNEAAVLAALALVLAHPQKITETRIPEKDQVLVLTDGSASQSLEERRLQVEQADTALHEALQKLAPEIEPLFRQLPAEDGTPVFSALQKILEEVDGQRLSAVLLVSDGQATDGPSEIALPAPLHVLLTGNPKGFDRRLEVKQAPVYGIVGKTAPVTFRAMDDGNVPAKEAEITLTADGETVAARRIAPGEQATFEIPIRHAGDMTVMLSTPGVRGEVTERNNRQAFTVRGVRERLRVLLVSGEANIGQRTWRNILKSDPAIDLVHFTILRTPQSVDRTPPSEMSLIPFPVEELFSKKLDSFDLIVFDHFGKSGLLPSRYLENIAQHVRKKAGLLYVSAPYAPPMPSPYITFQTGRDAAALESLLPAETADNVVRKVFLPTLSPAGERHPVTASLRNAPNKGKWLGYLPVEGAATGDVLLTTPEGGPLMVLAHAEGGRVAQFLSDQPWLWARGYDGGGPYLLLLRHLVHWLVQEPELEEERLVAEVKPTPEGSFILKVTRFTIKETLPASITVTAPDGTPVSHPLTLSAPGQAEAQLPVKQPGLYHISDGELSREVVVGDGNSKEFVEVVATEKKLAPLARTSQGSFHWLKNGLPALRRVESGSMASGHDWIGLPRRDAGTVTGVKAEPLLPPLFSAMLILALLAWAWHRETR